MMNATRIPFLLFAALLFLAAPAAAQEAVLYTLQSDTEVSVDGTSNKSDWTVYASDVAGFLRVNPEAAAGTPGVEEVQITVPSAKLVSRRSTIMDRLMRKAMKVEEHPEIVYVLKEVVSVTPGADASSYSLLTRGDLTLSGETREIEMTVVSSTLDGGKRRFDGSYTLLMSDYNIERPTAMFGALITGDEVTVNYKAVFDMSATGSR